MKTTTTTTPAADGTDLISSTGRQGRLLVALTASLAVLTASAVIGWSHEAAPSPRPAQTRFVPGAGYLVGGTVYDEQVPSGARVARPGSSVYDEQVPAAAR